MSKSYSIYWYNTVSIQSYVRVDRNTEDVRKTWSYLWVRGFCFFFIKQFDNLDEFSEFDEELGDKEKLDISESFVWCLLVVICRPISFCAIDRIYFNL